MKQYIILFLAFCTFKIYAQEEYVYSNSNYDVEVTFPSKPEVSVISDQFVEGASAKLSISSAGLTYIITIALTKEVNIDFNKMDPEIPKWMSKMANNKVNKDMNSKDKKKRDTSDIISMYKNIGYDVRIKDLYRVSDKEITELEMLAGGACRRQKEIKSGKLSITLSVESQICAQDKDIFPFFNSFKIKGKSFKSPNLDNSKYTAYNIDYSAVGKTDTIKQIVYINSGKSIYKFEKESEVDNNIPLNTTENAYRFALIIGNEDYVSRQSELKSEMNVEFARNDASAFKEYCINTLGVPGKNITFLLDATAGQINQGINKLKSLTKLSNGKAQLILYYAGHGLPDEVTKEPYLIPADVSGANITSGIKLKDLYESLSAYPSERITIFLDACFTGGGRNAGLMATRGVKITPKADVLKGNIIVYSSSSGEESSLPYSEKKHGMFTYFLLKKLQETKGDLTYNDLSVYLQEKVPLESVLINSKEQNPVVNSSQDAGSLWKSWMVR